MRALSWGFRLQFIASTDAVRPRWRSSICARQKKARRSAGDQRAQDASLSSRCATGSGRKRRAEVRTCSSQMIRGLAAMWPEHGCAQAIEQALPCASSQFSHSNSGRALAFLSMRAAWRRRQGQWLMHCKWAIWPTPQGWWRDPVLRDWTSHAATRKASELRRRQQMHGQPRALAHFSVNWLPNAKHHASAPPYSFCGRRGRGAIYQGHVPNRCAGGRFARAVDSRCSVLLGCRSRLIPWPHRTGNASSPTVPSGPPAHQFAG